MLAGEVNEFRSEASILAFLEESSELLWRALNR
jgi:hypothetical protein